MHDAAIAAGLINEEEFEEVMLLLDDPQFTAFTPVMFSAMGRKPHDDDSKWQVQRHVEIRPPH